ncbi:4-hydroxy 2-oxovalerate aldolase [Yimella lutea]|uniref:4-hydroxy 2-oxovalerate aldolase n=2 Tax=Yimella lutea TaxID=587872 RepID=A0A542EGQ3_9MICO|nr:4-hydroxy 2-oxovalerate aldolase [Yimella lutea]
MLHKIEVETDWDQVQILDCTLRDGSYAVDFEFEEAFVAELLDGLATSAIPLVEIGHGLGLEAERKGAKPGNIHHAQWAELAQSHLNGKPWGMFAQPDFTRIETIASLSSEGMSFIRVGMEPEKVPANTDYLLAALDSCPNVYLNLMKTSSTAPKQLPGLLDTVPAEVAGVYVVDSYGAMIPDDVDRYVSTVKQLFPVIGFHGHDNLGLANINSLSALLAGATIADGCLNGIGRGSGNASTESLAAIINLLDSDHFRYQELAPLAELCREEMTVIAENREMHVLGAVIGMHSGFFPLIQEASANANVRPADLMQTAANLAEQAPGPQHIRGAAEQLCRSVSLPQTSGDTQAAVPQ